ncbi:MAG: ABC transporter permease [Acidimicrobiales bacterium]
MNAVMWRLHRHQAAFGAAALIGATVVLLVTGLVMAGDYHRAAVGCASTASCSSLAGQLFQGDGLIIDLVDASIAVPILLGMFWGVPLLAKEVESGTHVLAWTQSMTRRRWIATKAGWALAGAAASGAAVSALVTWWRSPEDALQGGRFGVFDITGVVPVAYGLFAVALGMAAGAVLRRVLPAMAVTLVGFAALRLAVGLWLRPHLLAPVRHAFALVNDSSGAPPGSWVLSRVVVSPGGKVLSSVAGIPGACHTAYFRGRTTSCLASLGYRRLVTYQPAGRFWALQGIEAGLFLALGVVLVGVAFWFLLRRDA